MILACLAPACHGRFIAGRADQRGNLRHVDGIALAAALDRRNGGNQPLGIAVLRLGQHGAGSSALQAVAACLSIRRELVPPTINYDEPDPACGPLQVVTEALIMPVQRVLVNAIGLGGFYYSVAAFEACESGAASSSGIIRAKWSAQHHPRFLPADEFHAPIEPWSPRTG